MSDATLTLADFHGTEVSIIDHAAKRWLTAEQIGLCLGYADTNARDGIIKLYNRHADEFAETDTCTVKLTAQGQIREMRIFSDTGCNLLSFFANTARAKEFRAWAKQVLVGQTPVVAAAPVLPQLDRIEQTMATMARNMGELVDVSLHQARKLDVTERYIGLLEINQRGTVRVTREVEADVRLLFAQGMARRDIGRLHRISPATVSLLINGKYVFSPTLAATAIRDDVVQAAIEDRLAVERGRVEAYRALPNREGGAA